MAWTRKKTRRGRTVYLGCYRDPHGQERSRQFDTEREALRWAIDEEDAALAGDWMDPATRDITFEDWVPRWVRSRRGVKWRTMQGYMKRLGVHPKQRDDTTDGRIGRHWNHWRLRDIHRDAINAWVDQLEAEGLAPNYVKQHLALLRNVLQEAVLSGILGNNPSAGIRPPRVRPVEGRWLDADEVDRLAAAFDRANPGWGTWVLVVAYGGLRWGESVALRRRHVDLPGHRLEVLRAVAEVDGVLLEEDAKTTGPVDLPGFVVDRLTAWMDERCEDGPNALVFPSPAGGYLRYGNFRRYNNGFDQAVRDCGWSPSRNGGVTPHVLRHSCATMLIDAGANPQVVRTQMRHSDISVTFNVYGHLFPGAVADVWRRVADERRGGDVIDLEGRRRAASDDD